jgi:hypothetical protein
MAKETITRVKKKLQNGENVCQMFIHQEINTHNA